MNKHIEPPNYTQIPNSVLDNMGDYSKAELKVILCACRHTSGLLASETKRRHHKLHLKQHVVGGVA